MSQSNESVVTAPGRAVETWYESLQCSRPLLVVISGPSGVGKDATIQLMKECGHSVDFVVTATSRKRRPNEVDGVDYHFVTEEEFTDLIARGELLEHAVVYGQYKGIPKEGIRKALASGRDVVMRVDVQGAATVCQIVPQAITIFLTAESEDALVERLKRRQTENPDEFQQRIDTARAELHRASKFKYRVVNRECSLDQTVEEVIAIMQAEKCRVDWEPVEL